MGGREERTEGARRGEDRRGEGREKQTETQTGRDRDDRENRVMEPHGWSEKSLFFADLQV